MAALTRRSVDTRCISRALVASLSAAVMVSRISLDVWLLLEGSDQPNRRLPDTQANLQI
jgi:hypothetical protein